MDRRPVTRKLAVALGSAVLALVLASCSPFDIVGAVTTQVKLANNKFLVVKASGPFAANDQNVSPGTTIWVTFDRDLDTSSVGTQSAVFLPAQAWTWSYNPTTRTLTILPTSLESLTTYTVTIGGGLKGLDGNDMQTSYSVSFMTKQAPSGTMVINSGGTYATNANVTLNFAYNAATTELRWSKTESDIADTVIGGNQGLWATKTPTVATNLGADASYTIYYQFHDVAGNVTPGYNAIAGTHPLSATVIVDHLPPTNGASYSINNGDVNAATTSVTLTSAVTDATSPVEMRVQNFVDGTTWGAWQDYNAALPWTVSSPGTRVVNVQFRDKAGNTDGVTYTDAIVAGAPTYYIPMNNHSLAAVGQVYSLWNISPPDVGTDTYYLAWRFPGGAWNNQYATTTALNDTVGQGTEVILEWAVQMGNPSAGAFSSATAAYSNVMPAYTSNIAIIYNDGDANDTALATAIKAVLKNSNGWKATFSVLGTMPSWTVTLLPQSFISTLYGSYNRVYGYPLIVTPGVTNYNVLGWVRNITQSVKGIIAMGEGGARMLDTISANLAGWNKGGGGQAPNQIGWSHSANTGSYYYSYARTSGNSVWISPLYYSTPSLADNTLVYIGYSLQRISAYVGGGAPVGGYIYSTDYLNTLYANTVQQGRFLQYGYYGLAGSVSSPPYAPYYGYYMYSNFVDLVYRMSDAYYP